MMEKNYSQKPLIKKLGIKEEMTILVINTPDNYFDLLGTLPQKVVIKNDFESDIDFLHFFTKSQETLKETFPKLKKAIAKNGMLWVSWPKGTCNIRTDLNDNIIRQIGLQNGLVDVKICSVDDTWSAMKFVYRLKDR